MADHEKSADASATDQTSLEEAMRVNLVDGFAEALQGHRLITEQQVEQIQELISHGKVSVRTLLSVLRSEGEASWNE